MEALITGIKRFAVHDGDGIRMTFFLKGCPLRCMWCHNPETLSPQKQLAFMQDKCVSCGKCTQLCNANVMENGKHIFLRDRCVLCEKCVDICPIDAFKVYGESMTEEEMLNIALEDKKFYDTSGGGVTLSGGECLLYPDFCESFLKKMKAKGINTAVDTCGYVAFGAFERVMPYTDTFLYDIKAIDEGVHKKCTGVSNKLILENLKKLDEKGAKIEARIPFVPGFNDKEIPEIGRFLTTLKNLKGVRVLKYHNMAGSKYSSLGIENKLPDNIPDDDEIKRAKEVMSDYGINVI